LEVGRGTGAQEPDSLVHAEHPEERTGLAAQRRAVELLEVERGEGGGSGKFELVDIGKFPSPGESRPSALLSTMPKWARWRPSAFEPLLPVIANATKSSSKHHCPSHDARPIHRHGVSRSRYAAGTDIRTFTIKRWPRFLPIHRQLPRQTHLSFDARAKCCPD